MTLSDSEDSHINSQLQPTSQVALQRAESRANTLDPENTTINTTIKVNTRPIWPGHPELIYQAYVAEKNAWLAANPALQPAKYRTKRGFTRWSESWCRQNKKLLPYQRLDLQSETLIPGDPNWSYEELRAWLDWHEKKQAEADQGRKVAEYSAIQAAETARAVYVQEQMRDLASLDKQRAVETARIEQEKAVAVAMESRVSPSKRTKQSWQS